MRRPHLRALHRCRSVVVASVLAAAAVALAAPPAAAVWSASGTGTGAAAVGTLAPPTGVTVTSSLSTVAVSWGGVTPPSGSLTGYFVTRWASGVSSPACGTSATDPLSFVTSTGCTDSGVPDGTFTYRVTAVWRSWTSTSTDSNLLTVVGDPTQPSQSVALTAGTNAALVGATLYYRSAAAGSFQIAATVNDGQSGPASATFPAVSTSGWTHANETVTTGTGTSTSKTYTSSLFTWMAGASQPPTYTVTGRDVSGNTVTTGFAFAADDSAPTAASLVVNGVAATSGGTASTARAAFLIDSRVDYSADTGSGVSTSVLTRETAPLTGNACGTFGAPVVLSGTPQQSGLTTGCYRYTLTGTDLVGNVSTVSTTVRYDLVAPTPAFSITSTAAYVGGSVVYYRGNVAGSLVLNAAVTDQESGPASAAFPLLSRQGWTHAAETDTTGTGTLPTLTYSSSAFTWTANPKRPATYTVTTTDVAGNSTATAFTWTSDTTAPTGGSLTVNATGATQAGSTSTNTTGSFALSRTDYSDASSGIGSSVLTREFAPWSGGACGAFGPSTQLTGAPSQTGLASGCYRYRLTGTDNVGNTVSVSTVVKVDANAPTGGALTVNGSTATTAGTTSYARGAYAVDLRTDFVDAESGLASSTLVRTQATLSNGVCGAFGGATTLTGAPTQSGLTTNTCYRYTLTGTDALGNTSSLATTVLFDATAPTGGALSANGTAATSGGTTSTSTTGSWAVSRTLFTDGGSGMAVNQVTRSVGTNTGGVCSAFQTPTVFSSTSETGLAVGCYRYVLTGTDAAGNTVSLTTTVVRN